MKLLLAADGSYMWEYPIARAYADARMCRIGGDTAEVMKLIIGNALVPKVRRAH